MLAVHVLDVSRECGSRARRTGHERPEIAIALLREFFNYEMGPALAAVDVPVRYINAGMYPTNPEVNQKYNPGFSGFVVPDVGHFLMMEAPEEFNGLLRQVVAALESAG